MGYDLDALRPALDALDALAALHEPAAGVQELSSLHGKGSAA